MDPITIVVTGLGILASVATIYQVIRQEIDKKKDKNNPSSPTFQPYSAAHQILNPEINSSPA